MPVVEIKMFEGRSKEVRRKLIQETIKTVSSVLGIEKERIHVIITNVSKDDWGLKGDQASKI